MWQLISLSIICYIVSLAIIKVDTNFDYRWLAFWLHISSITIILGIYISKTFSKLTLKKIFSEQNLNPLLLILAITLFVNFLLLPIYPYVNISDELRDGGLYTAKIASGAIKNIFEYDDSYQSHGLIIQTLTTPFYYIFNNSPLTYRFFAAILSSIDVLLIYLLIRQAIDRKTAFWSAIILATLPLHMYFARTEVVLAFNFFWVPVILLLLFNLLKQHRLIDYILLGTILGFVCGFHAAIRSFALLILFILLFLEFKDIILKKIKDGEKILTRLSKIALLICFIVVGFGPRLLFTGTHNFFHTSEFAFENKIESQTPIATYDISTIKNNYIKSLTGYTYESVGYHYHHYKPILSPLLAIFFILGIIYALFVLKNYFLNILLFILISIPFLNSAITNLINADHRLSPLFSITAIFVAIGITFWLNFIKNKWIKYISIGIITFYLLCQVTAFYINQPAQYAKELKYYLTMHTWYFLQADKQYQASPVKNLQYMNSSLPKSPVCLHMSPANYQYFNGNIGSIEQTAYLLPAADIQYSQENYINDNEVYITKNSCSNKLNLTSTTHTYKISCPSSRNIFACPPDYKGDILIHY
jgi:4-amino-4-deoxy-L-arabinose transferase-like glycosyltransferase